MDDASSILAEAYLVFWERLKSRLIENHVDLDTLSNPFLIDVVDSYPVEGLAPNILSRIRHEQLKYHTYRTYRPGYTLRRRRQRRENSIRWWMPSRGKRRQHIRRRLFRGPHILPGIGNGSGPNVCRRRTVCGLLRREAAGHRRIFARRDPHFHRVQKVNASVGTKRLSLYGDSLLQIFRGVIAE